ETRSADVARSAAIDPVKSLEKAREVLLGDTRPRITDEDAHLVVGSGCRDLHGGAGSVLDGVVDEIGQDLLEGAPIGKDREPTLDLSAGKKDRVARSGQREKVDHVIDELPDFERHDAELELLRLDAAELQQIFHQLVEPFAVASDDLDEFVGGDR